LGPLSKDDGPLKPPDTISAPYVNAIRGNKVSESHKIGALLRVRTPLIADCLLEHVKGMHKEQIRTDFRWFRYLALQLLLGERRNELKSETLRAAYGSNVAIVISSAPCRTSNDGT
jgi:hypothetical protein